MSVVNNRLLTNEGAQNFLVEVIKEKDPDLLAAAVLFLIKARGPRIGEGRRTSVRVESLLGELGFEIKVQ